MESSSEPSRLIHSKYQNIFWQRKQTKKAHTEDQGPELQCLLKVKQDLS